MTQALSLFEIIEQFKKYFEQFGTIEDSVIMVDKDTGKSRGLEIKYQSRFNYSQQALDLLLLLLKILQKE